MSNHEQMEPWVLLESRSVYEGYVRVRQDDYRMSNGATSAWDVILEGPTVVVVAFTTGIDHVVVFDQFRVGPGRVLTELPGGAVEDGEDPVDAGRRELLEETGYQPIEVFAAGSEWSAGNSPRRKHVLIAAGCGHVRAPVWDAEEMGRVHLLPTDRLMKHLLSGELTDAGQVLRGLHVFGTEPVPESMRPVQDVVRELLRP